jgi:hypothetical protein
MSLESEVKILVSIAEKNPAAIPGIIKGLQETGRAAQEAAKAGDLAAKKEAEQIKDVIAELKKLDKEFDNTKKSAENAGKGLSDANDALGKIAQFGPEGSGALSSLAGEFLSVGEAAGPTGVAIAGFLAILTGAVAAAASFTATSAEYTKEQLNLQKATGASKELIAGLSLGLARNGGDSKEAADGLLQLGQIIQDSVNNPTGEAAKNLDRLGIAVKDSAGKAKSIEQVFREIDAAASGAGLSQERLIALSQILGEDTSKKLLPFIGNLSELEKQAAKTGLVVDKETSQALQNLTAQFANTQEIAKGLAVSIGGQLAPSFEKFFDQISIAIDFLSSNDQITQGLKVFIDLVGGFIATAGPALVDILTGAVEAIANLGIFIRDVGNEIDAFKEKIFGKKAATEEDKEATEKHTKAIQQAGTAAQSAATEIAKLTQEVNKLKAEQKAATDNAEANAKLQILAYKEAAQAGVISQKQANDAIAKLEDELADKRIANAFEVVGKLKIPIEERERQLKDALDAIAVSEKTAANNGVRFAVEENIQRKKLLDEFAAFKKERETALLEAQTALRNAEAAKRQAILNRETKEEGDEKKKRSDQDKELFDKTVKDNKEAVDQKVSALQLELAKIDELIAERKLDGATSQEILQLELQKIDAQITASKQRIQQLKDERFAVSDIQKEEAKLTKLQADRANKQATESEKAGKESKKASEKAEQESRRATEARNKETSAAVGAADAHTEFANAVEGLGDRAKSAAGNLAAIAAVAQGIQNFFKFDFDPSRIAEANEKLIEFRKILQETSDEIRSKNNPVLLIFQKEVVSDAIKKLEEQIKKATTEAARKAEEEAGKARMEKAKETVERLKDLEKKAQDDLLEIRRERRKAERDLEQDRLKEEEDFNKDREQAQKDLLDDLAEDQKDFNERARERDIQEKRAAIERERDFQKNKRDIAREAQEEAIDDQLDSILEQDKINDKIKELQKQAQDPTLDDKKRSEIAGEIKKQQEQLAGVQKKAAEQQERDKKKQEEIAKAGAESKNQEEFDTRKAAIDRNFKIAEDEAKGLADLGEDADIETIARVKALFAEKRRLSEEALQDELNRQQAEEADKQERRKEERQKELDDLNQKRQDKIDAFNEEQKDREEEHAKRVKEFDEREDEIKESFKESQKKIREELDKSLSDIAKSLGLSDEAFKKYYENIKNGAIDFNKVLDDTLKKLKQIEDAAKGGGTLGSDNIGQEKNKNTGGIGNTGAPNNTGGGNGSGLFNVTVDPSSGNPAATPAPNSSSSNNSEGTNGLDLGGNAQTIRKRDDSGLFKAGSKNAPAGPADKDKPVIGRDPNDVPITGPGSTGSDSSSSNNQNGNTGVAGDKPSSGAAPSGVTIIYNPQYGFQVPAELAKKLDLKQLEAALKQLDFTTADRVIQIVKRFFAQGRTTEDLNLRK